MRLRSRGWSANASLHEALLTDSDEMLRANVSEDFEEGKRAFMEKRTPRFTGQ
jgi:enoyl-CoA hydratase/carnithine racemase